MKWYIVFTSYIAPFDPLNLDTVELRIQWVNEWILYYFLLQSLVFLFNNLQGPISLLFSGHLGTKELGGVALAGTVSLPGTKYSSSHFETALLYPRSNPWDIISGYYQAMRCLPQYTYMYRPILLIYILFWGSEFISYNGRGGAAIAVTSIWVILKVALLTVWADWPPCFTAASDARFYRFSRR
jgi:hypothetical protein